MSSSISGFHYEENQIGGAFISSKIEYIWEFVSNGSSPNKIQLIYSKWTDNKRLFKNGIEVFNKKNDDSFLKNFEIDGHIFSIIQLGDKFELRVDNQSFTYLYNLEKNKNFFTDDSGPTSKTQIADNSTGDIISEKDENNLYIFKNKENDNKEKKGLFNFKIKIDENKANSGLKKFKFGPGIKSNINKFNKNTNNNENKDLLGFGDIIQNNVTNNSSSNNNNNNNINNDDFFGLGIISNNDNNNKIGTNNGNNDLFNFGNNNKGDNNNNNFLNFDSNTNDNKKDNTNIKTTNEQLVDIFNSLSQNNQSNNNNINDQNINQNKENIQNDIPLENKQEMNGNSNDNKFSFPSSESNDQTNIPNSNTNKEENKNKIESFNQQTKDENEQENCPKLNEINSQNNNNDVGFSFDFVKQESNNPANLAEFKPSSSGFDYEAFNNAKNTQPKTNNDKLDNALKNLF